MVLSYQGFESEEDRERRFNEFFFDLRDQDGYIRGRAVTQLREWGDKRAVPALIESLQDDSSYVRSQTAKALGKLGDISAVEPLLTILKDVDWEVRCAVAGALGDLGDIRAVDPLLAVLFNPSSGLDTLVAAIHRADPTGFPYASTPNSAVRLDVIVALGKLGDARAIRPLQEIQLMDEAVQDEAVRAIGQIRAKLKEFPSPEPQAEASSPELDRLITALNDPNYNVLARRAIALTLADSGDSRALPALAQMQQNDPDYTNRSVAAQVIAKIKAKPPLS